MNQILRKRIASLMFTSIRSNGWGSGSGKGGGSGGSVRDAGGSFGKMEAAREEEYFRKQQVEQLKDLRDLMEQEITLQKELINQSAEEINHQKEIIKQTEEIGQNKDLDSGLVRERCGL